MATSENSARTALPAEKGAIASSVWMTWRSLIARDTTWPVRIVSCLPPSKRLTAANTAWRRSCWTSTERRPAS